MFKILFCLVRSLRYQMLVVFHLMVDLVKHTSQSLHLMLLKGYALKKIYGGCGGNDNSFQSLSSCQATCGESKVKLI